jgi:hypothetical protein
MIIGRFSVFCNRFLPGGVALHRSNFIDAVRDAVSLAAMPWRPSIDALKLKRANDELAARLLRAKDELQAAERRRIGLEVLLTTRGERIDRLTVLVDQLRTENKRLDTEAEFLAQLFRRETATGSDPKQGVT